MTSSTYAPVSEISRTDPMPRSGSHRVTSGETLYSIAWRYGLDYQDLANVNNIAPPYTVYLGQEIQLKKPRKAAKVKTRPIAPAQTKKQAKVSRAVYKDQQREPAYRVKRWKWPLRGRIVRNYSQKNKGIDIGAKWGQSVRATAPGKVVYSGNGLKSYGNLIIIKHNARYLSAYAYNRAVKVKEGDWVRQGQVIALAGHDSHGRARLHFEIRRNGRSVNPKTLLRN